MWLMPSKHKLVICLQDLICWMLVTYVQDGISLMFAHLKGSENGGTTTSAIKQVGQELNLLSIPI